MKREDLRSKIIPTTIENTDEFLNLGNKEFNTTDLIYIDNLEEIYEDKKTDIERRISATDYAQMNYAYEREDYRTRTGRRSTWMWLRSDGLVQYIKCVCSDGHIANYPSKFRSAGLCPSLHYQLPSEPTQSELQFSKKEKNIDESEEPEQFDIREVKDTKGKTIYHTLQIGEYPKTIVDEDLSKTLESLYNKGNLNKGILCTGRWYSGNSQKDNSKDYAGAHNPEFEYQGKRYVRVVSYPNDGNDRYSDGTLTEDIGTIRWAKVEPISFVIKNWDEMPKWINPEGNETAKYFDLRSEEVIIANIPFYTNDFDKNSSKWQNSTIRGFLNGIDVRNIKSNGNIAYGAKGGGNFIGECNFLNEAFNLSREPMIEYTIPDSEKEISDDAFNGCLTLKKIVLHSGIKAIGKRAFEGLSFKYAYKTKTGELVFSQELPENEEEYKDVIEINKLTKSFKGFDYGILLQPEKLTKFINLAEILNKNNFSIPYVYGQALIESEKTKSFCENSDFRFFKSEIPNINDMLLDFPEEERLNFFKFANSLGCFSKEKMLDKRGRETQVIVAQKASSLLAQLLKTEEMKLRYI